MKNLRFYFPILLLLIGSCSKDESVKDIVISDEISKLIYSNGNLKADGVLITVQGGPLLELVTEEFDELMEKVNTTDLLAMNVHQSQTLNPKPFDKIVPFEKMKDYNAETIEILSKVIRYFKNQNRKVYVLGISFGALVVQELLVKKGVNIADNYLIMVGRLDIEEEAWKALSKTTGVDYEDGITPIYEEYTDREDINAARMAADLFQNRYTQQLSRYNDLSMVTYVYGKKDEALGRLSDSEIEFLKSKNVNIIESPDAHSETTDNYIKQGFKECFGI